MDFVVVVVAVDDVVVVVAVVVADVVAAAVAVDNVDAVDDFEDDMIEVLDGTLHNQH